MRIISGRYKWKKLNSPASDHIRPTSDRMRESIFNMLEHGSGPGISQNRVLDLFAGTGAFGIESISRDAAMVTFVDNDRQSIELVKQNMSLIDSAENISLKCINSLYFHDTNNQYDIIFIDPPYNKGLITPTLTNIHERNILANDCVIVT